MLPAIPFVDIRGGTPLDLMEQHEATARSLARAAMGTFGLASRAASTVLMPLGDRASRRWLARTDNPYLAEIDALAAHLGISGVHFLNVCFEWGCTSGVWRGPDGPVLRRVLDWAFPQLGTHMVVALQSGPAGEFYNPTWPGLAGSFQGLAPGRFAAAINQAPMRRHRRGIAGDWLRNRIAVRDGIGDAAGTSAAPGAGAGTGLCCGQDHAERDPAGRAGDLHPVGRRTRRRLHHRAYGRRGRPSARWRRARSASPITSSRGWDGNRTGLAGAADRQPGPRRLRPATPGRGFREPIRLVQAADRQRA
ncbi:MAG: hypothetical protein WDN03_03795 [Rhizomicrobium sp.]